MKSEKAYDLLQEPDEQLSCWIGNDVLPKGGTLVLGGEAKIGKSHVMLELVRALSTGTPPFEMPMLQVPEPCKVLLIDQELGRLQLKKRLKKVFARHQPSTYRDTFDFITREPVIKLESEEGRTELLEAVEHFRPNVLILDPISKLHNFEENSNADILKLCTLLETFKKAYMSNGMSIIMAHHFRKPPTGKFLDDYDPLDPYNFRGSSNYYGDADTLLTFDRHELPSSPGQWKFKCRWTMRHGIEIPEMWLHVDPDATRKNVWFDKWLVAGTAPINNFNRNQAVP